MTQTEGQPEKDAVLYELGYHIIPITAKGQLDSEVKKLTDLIEKNGGNVKGGELPELMELAYDMDQKIDNQKKTFDKAYFGWFNFEVTPDAIENIQEGLEANESLLRFLLVKKEVDDTPEGGMVARTKKNNNKKDTEDEDEDDNDDTEEDEVSEEEEKEELSDEEIDEKIDELI